MKSTPNKAIPRIALSQLRKQLGQAADSSSQQSIIRMMKKMEPHLSGKKPKAKLKMLSSGIGIISYLSQIRESRVRDIKEFSWEGDYTMPMACNEAWLGNIQTPTIHPCLSKSNR